MNEKDTLDFVLKQEKEKPLPIWVHVTCVVVCLLLLVVIIASQGPAKEAEEVARKAEINRLYERKVDMDREAAQKNPHGPEARTIYRDAAQSVHDFDKRR